MSENTLHPVKLEIPRQGTYNRWLAAGTLLFMTGKILILLPHIIVLYVLGIAAFIAGLIAQVAVLFTGKYPYKLFHFVTKVMRWQMRVNSYMLGLTDVYPPFSFE